jgi:hypothetical protein
VESPFTRRASEHCILSIDWRPEVEKEPHHVDMPMPCGCVERCCAARTESRRIEADFEHEPDNLKQTSTGGFDQDVLILSLECVQYLGVRANNGRGGLFVSALAHLDELIVQANGIQIRTTD